MINSTMMELQQDNNSKHKRRRRRKICTSFYQPNSNSFARIKMTPEEKFATIANQNLHHKGVIMKLSSPSPTLPKTYHSHRNNKLYKSSLSGFLLTVVLSLMLSRTLMEVATNQIVDTSTNNNNGPATTTSRYLTIAANSLSASQQVLSSFSTPNQSVNITHVTYDPISDTVYLGATNIIYQLSGSDLKEQQAQVTGPVFDNPACGISECHGYEDFMKPTQNVNKILVIDYQHKKLLSCGSTKQGACRRYQLNNIAQKEDLISMAVAANDDNSSTYAFIAPARYTYDPSTTSVPTSSQVNSSQQQQQQVLYVAATYTKVGQSRDLLVPAIGTRTLDDGPNLLKLYENSFLDSARIDINSHLRDYFLVNYLYGFASTNYIYFVTVQKKATSRDYEELGYHTRLARICITDSSYNSYTEVDLKCMPNKRKFSDAQKHPSFFNGQATSGESRQQQASLPNEYPILQDAILIDSGSQLLQSLAQNDQSSPLSSDFFYNNPSSGSTSPDDSKVLLGVFSSAKDHTQHAGEHSALCAFSLSQIEDKFNDNIHNCYTGKMQSRNMEYIAGNVQDCPKSGQGGNVVNFCHETLKINGTLPIVSEASIQFFNTTLTAIAATSHIDPSTKNIYSDQQASEFASINPSSATKSTSSATTSIPSSNLANRQHTVVFMGTSNGHIKKVLLNNASNGIEFEDVQLDTNPILSDLHLHSSGQQLIAATPYKVMKVPVHNCQQYSTCRECSQSKNPYCGWCSLKRSCTTKSECVSSGSSQSSSVQTANEATTATLLGSNAAELNAASKQFKWISNDSAGKCIDLQSIVPDKIPITSTGKVDLYIDRLPRLPKEHNYKCIFDKKEQTTATSMSFGLSCPLPKVMHRPKIQPGRDHAIVDLAVRSSETNTDFLSGKITFFECQLHTTCKDCLTTNWGCNWCLNENICLFNTSKCEKTGGSSRQTGGGELAGSQVQLLAASTTASTQAGITVRGLQVAAATAAATTTTTGGSVQVRSGNTINLVNQCPTFDVGHKQDILIADGSEKELTIKVKNMPQFKGNIQCQVEIENDKILLKARIEGDRVICENSTYSYAADVGLLNGQLVVMYSDNNIFIDRTNFSIYKCHLLGAYLNRPDCSLCQRIDERFNCAWCSGTCQHRWRCIEPPEATCPPPRIDYIYPLSGPTLGGTKLTIEGSNLGQSFEEIANRVTVGNVPCRPIEDEYKLSNKIVCLTGPVKVISPSRRLLQSSVNPLLGDASQLFAGDTSNEIIFADVMVGNKAGYSLGQSKFQYKTIQLRDHQPRYGPQSGGTRITLTGANLNIGSNIQVFLDELPCQVEASSISAERIVCRTSASRHASRPIRQLKLIIDDAQIIRDDAVFYYTQDPIITRIWPLSSYLSGGRQIYVYGANLTTVQQPRMAVLDATGKRINESACVFIEDSRMYCPSPFIDPHMVDLEWSEQHISQYEPQTIAQAASSTWTPIASMQQQQAIKFSQSSSQSQSQFIQSEQSAAISASPESVRFRLSFIMDNVWRLRDLQASYPAINTEIIYTSDPKLFPFASNQYKSAQEIDFQADIDHLQQQQQQQQQQQSYQVDPDTYLLQPGQPSLVLYGEHLQTSISDFEITVNVGADQCNLTQLGPNKLVCVLPLDHMATPTDELKNPTQKALPLVVVRIGFNLRFELGYVQYHPQLVDQIVQTITNSSDQQQLPYRATYPEIYVPPKNESLLHKISNYITTLLVLVLYMAMASVILASVYSGLNYAYKLRRRSHIEQEYKRIQSRVDSLERSVRAECKMASLALQGDLNELVRHVDLSGIPLLGVKHYIMKVFFPGLNNHPLLVKCSSSNSIGQQNLPMVASSFAINGHTNQQANLHRTAQNHTSLNPTKESANFMMLNNNQQPSNINNHLTMPAQPLKTSADFPMEYFERLILSKPFLVTFINTLERQPSFTIRDKVNVASLIMVVLMERLDYATDILRTLLFQLVERSVMQGGSDSGNSSSGSFSSSTKCKTSKLAQRASNLLGGLPIGKRGSRAAGLGKVVGGSASSLMQSTTMAAQMLLSRVGNKTSPLHAQHNSYMAQLDANSATIGHNMSTTAFNQRNTIIHTIGGRANQRSSATLGVTGSHTSRKTYDQDGNQHQRRASAASGGGGGNGAQAAHLMLRRTDSIVEKMLTNWLALSMYDYFHGEVGQSLYMMFEALKYQLDRGPIDSISGDAYYSLNEHKLLREPHIQYELVNLYVIVDTSILQPDEPTSNNNNSNNSNNTGINNNLLLESSTSALAHHHNQSYNLAGQAIYDEGAFTINRSTNYAASNTITLALRVLDCDTISQVKGKILNALYRNSPYSSRLGVVDVELQLRQQQPLVGQPNVTTNGAPYVNVSLFDEDYSNVTAFNGSKRINTLRHYGVTDQAIMLLNRCRRSVDFNQSRGVCQSTTRTTLTDMLDEHYNNPYSEIQYGHIGAPDERQQVRSNHAAAPKSWHLIRTDERGPTNHLSDHTNSNESSPSSHSPSILLLGNESLIQTTGNNNQTGFRFNQQQRQQQQQIHNQHHHQQQQQQQFYHPSSSSTSSNGNVLDTNSTSVNSSSMNVTNLLVKSRNNEQPIYCQIGSVSGRSQRGVSTNNSNYYQLGPNNVSNIIDYPISQNSSEIAASTNTTMRAGNLSHEQENRIYLARMLTSKGTVQSYIDDFFKTILSVRAGPNNDENNFNQVLCRDSTNSTRRPMAGNPMGACPQAVKWLFDLLDEAALENGIADPDVIHAWKSNAFLLRFWVNLVKNPNYILDVEKSSTMDATLSVVAQTLMDSCSVKKPKFNKESNCNKLLFSKNIPKYKNSVKRFYQDIASMRPVSDQEIVKQMSSISMMNAGRFDTNLALKELCVYAVNYGVELMEALNNDFTCQQMDLSQQLEQCFRSFTIFEAYR